MENIGILGLVNELAEKSLITSQERDRLIAVCASPFQTAETAPSWRDVRASFFENPNEQFKIEPMNSANLCPTFYPVIQSINTNRIQFNHDISIQHRQAMYRTIVPRIRQIIADFIGANPKNIALVRNTSEGNNQLSRGFNKWEGKEVLLWEENHPTNRQAWHARSNATKKVKEFSLKNIDFKNGNDQQILDAIIKTVIDKITPETAVLSFTEVSNISGIRLPSSAIIKAVRAYERSAYRRAKSEIHIHVDGAISWGALNLNLIEMDCDSFSSSSHKWLMGPFETGVFYMKSELASNFDISIYGYNGLIDFVEPIPNDTSRFELLGQRDDANIFALGVAIEMHNRINGNNKSRIELRIKELQAELRKKISDQLTSIPAVTVDYLTPESSNFSNGVTIFQIKWNNEIIRHDLLNTNLYQGSRRFAVASVGNDYLRICPHIMNQFENIELIVEKIRQYVLRNPEEHIVETNYPALCWPESPYAN